MVHINFAYVSLKFLLHFNAAFEAIFALMLFMTSTLLKRVLTELSHFHI